MVELDHTWMPQLAPLFHLFPMLTYFPLGCGSPLYSIHVFAQECHTPLDLFVGLFPQDSLMSSCNCIIMSFSYLIDPYASFPDFDYQPYSPSLSHVQPCRDILYIFRSLIPHFLPRGDLPSSVIILHIFPCIEHRYVPLLGTSLFSPGHSFPPSM